jgi:hypothetical protein
MGEMSDVSSWRFETFRDALAGLPTDGREEDTLRDDLRLFDDGKISLYYSPFDHVTKGARVVLMGITPGRFQHWKACSVARDALARGLANAEVLRLAKQSASFSGPMRKNLVAMLDGIRLNDALGLASTGSMFEEEGAQYLLSTSAVTFPVFVGEKNYTGSTPRLLGHSLLRAVVEKVFAGCVAMVPDALIVPLGRVATDAADHLVKRGSIDARRVLRGFPHPSGSNGHRVREYVANRDSLTRAVEAWFPTIT